MTQTRDAAFALNRLQPGECVAIVKASSYLDMT